MTQQPGGADRPFSSQTRERPDGERGVHRDAPSGDGAVGISSLRQYEYRERKMVMPTGSRIRGRPVWAGFVVALATWMLLELALFSLDLGALAANVITNADSSTWWWSGLAAVIAFFLGGLVAGASTAWSSLEDGFLYGITVWSLIVVTLIVLSAAGAGIGFGVVGDVLATAPSLADADASVINDAQTASAAALLALTVTMIAAAIGGALGSKVWPRENSIDLRTHDAAL